MTSACDMCMNYAYDEEYDEYMCTIDMDEDEIYSVFGTKRKSCPYYRPGDEYTIVRKQN